ncbi:MAG TPA: alpha/beta hydrolase [Chloroflexia bacterium]|nr:alpha/beta hydrolase [Chloroflexia bacterium]
MANAYPPPFGQRLLPLVFLLLLAPLAVSCNGSATPTATPAPAVTPDPNASMPPIILLHGWKGNLLAFDRAACPGDVKATPTAPDLGDLHGLEADLPAYKNITRLRMVSSPCYTPPITANVELLRQTIQEVKATSHYDQVILIAHSMGGLVAQAYVEGSQYEGYKDVCGVYTVGSPLVGIAFNPPYVGILGATAGLELERYLQNQEVMQDFLPAFLPNSFARTYPIRHPQLYHVIDGAPRNRTPLGLLTAFLGGSIPNDGLVPTGTGSQVAGSIDPTLGRIALTVIPEAHSASLGSPDYFSDFDNAGSDPPRSDTRRYLQAALATPPACSAKTPGSTGTAGAAPAASTPAPLAPAQLRPKCDAPKLAELVRNVVDDQNSNRQPASNKALESHLSDLDVQYAIDCADEGVTPSALAREEQARNLPVRLAAVGFGSPPAVAAANLLLTDGQGRQTGVRADGSLIRTIPGAAVLQVTKNNAVFVFYPAATTITTTISNPSTTSLDITVTSVQTTSFDKEYATTLNAREIGVLAPDNQLRIFTPNDLLTPVRPPIVPRDRPGPSTFEQPFTHGDVVRAPLPITAPDLLGP